MRRLADKLRAHGPDSLSDCSTGSSGHVDQVLASPPRAQIYERARISTVARWDRLGESLSSIQIDLRSISPHGERQKALSKELICQSHNHFMGAIEMYNYPVLECLVAFAIVFSIGYLVADSNSREETLAPKNEVART